MVNTNTLEGIMAASGGTLDPINPIFNKPSDTNTPPTHAFAGQGLDEQINMILALKDTDENLNKAWEAYKANNVAAFRAAVLASDFYRNNSAIARQRKTAQRAQPGAYTKELDAYKVTAKKRLVDAGIQWTPNIEKQIEFAYENGMTEDQVDTLVIKTGDVKGFGGDTLSSINRLKTFAGSYGVDNLLNKAWWDTKSQQLFTGDTTLTDIEQSIKELSASAYPAYADGIMRNVPLSAQASNVTQTIASLLEVDPDTLSFNDPRVQKIVNYVNPTTGKPERMPQWMINKTVKSMSGWPETDNGRQAIDDLSIKVLRDWGLA
jgi:hypothetical protein